MAIKKPSLAASIQVKNGRLYAAIQIKKNGKTQPVWRALGLPEGAPQSKVQKVFRQVVSNYEEEYAKKLAREGRPPADMSVYDYLCTYLEKTEKSIQKNTVRSYSSMLHGRIKQFFSARPRLTVENLKPRDIQMFYDELARDGLSNNSIIHFHAFMRRAFQYAFKIEMIDSNPFDRIERPKKEKFVGDHYSEDELRKLLTVTRTESIYPAIILAGCMGLRRSEALGVRWSRIDWDQKTVLLDTKIVEYEQNGKKVVEPIEQMKNKSSRRTLPLPEPVYEMLLEEKEKQDMYRRLFKSSYNRKYDDYVCVDNLGNLMRPSYVTQRYADLLKKYGLRHIRFHDLRHTFASILLGNDVPLINVSNFLGHSDISTTANIYAHLDKASKQASADVITDIFNEK